MSLPLPRPGDWPWLSLHDVCPATLERTEALASRIETLGRRATLLVIPDADWDETGLARLRALHGRGHDLAGHGWTHHTARWGGLAHRIHGWMISNRVAEHLAEDAAGRERIIRRCHAWFAENGLPEPSLYVPPAWAMGRIPSRRLQQLPFRYYETLGGIYSSGDTRFTRLPLAGFEADRPWRAHVLRLSNAVNRRLARDTIRLRIAIHPWDLDGPLRTDLLRLLSPPQATAAQSGMS
ncbi:MAG: DUF2334 domain-containing protein [Acidihalobacter sp.]|jgi:uncharacterized protein|uniref:DUF2334 domain-containing protein n=1 Tax=Acidihalobacter sp. TaxID=1872108 RepID=UPI00307D409A